jgi:hypothetical protein
MQNINDLINEEGFWSLFKGIEASIMLVVNPTI